MNNCNLTTCRYNENGKCTNEEKRKECLETVKKVLVYKQSKTEIPIWASDMLDCIDELKKRGMEINLEKVFDPKDVLYKNNLIEKGESDIMADLKKMELDIIEKAKAIAKEIAKGNDVYITKSASGVVIKKMTVGKV